jgi:hypothetical protein
MFTHAEITDRIKASSQYRRSLELTLAERNAIGDAYGIKHYGQLFEKETAILAFWQAQLRVAA